MAYSLSAATDLRSAQFKNQSATPTTPNTNYQRMYFTTTGPHWVDQSGEVNSGLEFKNQSATPTTPGSGYGRLYFASTGPRWINSSGDINSGLDLKEQASTPSTPDSGYGRLYFGSTGMLKWIDDGGNVNASLEAQYLKSVKTNTEDVGIAISGSSETLRHLDFLTGEELRWKVEVQDTAESGSNAGSNFQISVFDDDGAFLGFGLKIERSTRNFEIDGPLDHDGSTAGFYGNTPVSRQTYGAPTGTATRTTFATGSVTLAQLAERVKALIDDLRSVGLLA